MNTFDQIQHRLRQHVADYLNRNPEDLDRDTGYLLRRFSWELAILYQKLTESQDTIHDHIVRSLLPEVHTRALPAHAVVSAMPQTHTARLDPEQHVFTIPSVTLSEGTPKSFYFTPLKPTPLVKAKIRFIGSARGMYEIVGSGVRQQKLAVSADAYCHPGVWWLGIETPEAIPANLGLQFYVDWPNLPLDRKKQLYKLLHHYLWNIQERKLFTEKGFLSLPEKEDRQTDFLDHEYLRLDHIEKQVLSLYNQRFITVKQEKPFPASTPFPPEFLKCFDKASLEACFEKPLLWIRMTFPAGMKQSEIDSTRLWLNCFPVVNRKIDISKNFTPSENIEICSLNPKDDASDQGSFFLGIQRIFSGKINYRPAVFESFPSVEGGHYALQRGKVEARDLRDFQHRVAELFDRVYAQASLLKLGANHLLKNHISEKEKETRQLEEALPEKSFTPLNTGYYLHIKVREPGRMIHVRFWKTQGAYANPCAEAGDFLQTEGSLPLEDNSLRFITKPEGGQSPLSALEATARTKTLLAEFYEPKL